VYKNGKKNVTIQPCKLMENEAGDALVTEKIEGRDFKNAYYLGEQEPYKSLARSDATLEINVRSFQPARYVPLREANAEWIRCPAGDFYGHMSPGMSGFNAINIGKVHGMTPRPGEASGTFTGTWIRDAVSDIIIR